MCADVHAPLGESRDLAGTERQQRGTRQLLIARTCFFGCSYIASAVIARKLGAVNFGIYGVIVSLILWLEIVANAGIPAATAKLMADNRHAADDVESSARSLLVLTAFALLAASWLVAPFIAVVMGIPEGTLLLRLALLDLPLAGIYASYEGVLNGYRRFGAIALMHVGFGGIKLAGVLSLIAVGFSLKSVLVANVLASALACAALLVRYPPRRLRPNGRTLTTVLQVAGPMAVYLVSGQILVNLDLWLLKSLWSGNATVIGEYVASANLSRTLMLIPAVQAGVLFSSVAWSVASGDTARALPHVREATRFAVITAAAACVILGLNGAQVLSLLYSRQYAGGDRFLWLQLAGFGLFALVDAFSNALQAGGTRWRTAAALLPTIPLVWLSNVVLIPRWGPIAAAVSMVVGLGVSAMLTGIMVYRRFGSPVPGITVLRVIVAAAGVAVVSAVAPVDGPLVVAKLLVLGCAYLLILYVQGEITARDFRLRTSTRASL